MAVDEQQRRRDLYEVVLRSHDQRVALDGWTYYIRGVKRESEFTGGGGWLTAELSISGILLLVRLVRRLRDRKRPWSVGVVRLGSVETWNSVNPVLVHRELLPPDEDPGDRIDELVAEVRDGRFAPAE